MSTKPLNLGSGMPQMGPAFAGWAKALTLTKRVQVVTNALISYTTQNLNFRGTIQPLSPKLLALKPEGQRGWQWLQIHCFAGRLDLDDNDQIIYNGDIYKVMAILPYDLNNYIEYHLVKDYQP
jgi:hypothetical protein